MRRLLKVVLIFFIVTVATTAVLRISPKPPILHGYTFSSAVYDANSNLLRLEMANDETFRLYTPLEDISQELVRTTIFYEDRYFRYHPGVNPISLMKGFWISYIKKQRLVGASTVTMQLSRTVYNIDSRSIFGKMKQIFYALLLEAKYSKNDILEAYLNIVPYGHNIESVGAASLIYYHKRAKDLSLLESLTLSVIPQNPTKRAPTNPSGWSELVKSRNSLMKEWVIKHPEDKEKSALFSAPMKIYSISDLPYLAPHFVNGVLAQHDKPSGYSNELFTTIDMNKQSVLESTINTYIERNKMYGIYNAAALLVDTTSMNVLASVGSANFFEDSINGQVDGTRAMRSPGSVLKPFIFGLAIEQGLIHPHTLLKDAPRRFGLYSPENSDHGFLGPIFAQDALIHSRNIPAVSLLITLEGNSFLDLLNKAKIKNLKTFEHYGASLALGGFEVTMEDVATLYCSLNNNGDLHDLIKLKGVNLSDSVPILSPEATYITRDMLRHNPPPSTTGFKTSVAFPVAWKTGTSFRFRDGWTAAVFGKYVLVTWVGNFEGDGNSAFIGRSSAGPLAFEIIQNLTRYIERPLIEESVDPNLNIKHVDICAITGELPFDYCPVYKKTLFIPGVSPIKQSEIFLQIPIDIKTGLRACRYDSETTKMEVFEFWSSDILKIFESAGIRRKTPPPYMPDCSINYISEQGVPPLITYPVPHVLYDLSNSYDMQIPLTAASSADVSKIFWFVNNNFIGEIENGKSLLWKPAIGNHQIKAVDNFGRGSSITIDVI